MEALNNGFIVQSQNFEINSEQIVLSEGFRVFGLGVAYVFLTPFG